MALASILTVAPRVAAVQNRPTWSSGDFWVYSRTQGGATSTIRMDVHEQTTLTLALGTYTVWHVTQTTTSSTGANSVLHVWIQDSNIGIAKTNQTLPFFGDVQVTFDPPLAQAVFPLTVGAQWSLSSTLRVVTVNFSLAVPYSATVVAEQSTTVPAGSFSVAVIRSPPTGNSRTENHYSEGAGNSVHQDSYDGNGNRVAQQNLTAYRYQAGTLGLILLIVGAIVIAAIAVALFVVLRRRRSRMPPPGMAPPMQPPPP